MQFMQLTHGVYTGSWSPGATWYAVNGGDDSHIFQGVPCPSASTARRSCRQHGRSASRSQSLAELLIDILFLVVEI